MTAPQIAAPEVLSRHRELIEAALRAALGSGESPLEHAVRYVMGWEDVNGHPANATGKRIRPALCLFAAESFGAPPDAAIPGAVAVELVHNFSLVHDEVQDRDPERHHRPTLWVLMGEAQAINAGDYLYSRAIRALADATGPSDRRMRALSALLAAIGKMIAGQWDDIAFEQRDTVTVEEYLGMVARKTGALLGAPLEMGAILAGADTQEAALLGRWGTQVGLAFQAHDDFLGIWGNPDQTGKSNTNDISRRKKTLPVVHGLNHPESAGIIREAYAKPEIDATSIRAVLAALEAAGSDQACRQQARQGAVEAEALLAQLEFPGDICDQFREVASFLVERVS